MTLNDPSVFAHYQTAIARKLHIALYHRNHLAKLLEQPSNHRRQLPPIPIQAHFEGAVSAVVSMADQLVAGIADAIEGMPPPHQAKIAEVIKELAERRRDRPTLRLLELLRSLRYDALLNDARDIRNRARHRFYEKYDDLHGWYVESPQYIPTDVKRWTGDRYLLPYVDATIELACKVLEGSKQAGVWVTEAGTE